MANAWQRHGKVAKRSKEMTMIRQIRHLPLLPFAVFGKFGTCRFRSFGIIVPGFVASLKKVMFRSGKQCLDGRFPSKRMLGKSPRPQDHDLLPNSERTPKGKLHELQDHAGGVAALR